VRKPFDNGLTLRHKTIREIMTNHPYRIKREGGSYEYGTSDTQGRSHLIAYSKSEQIILEVLKK
jgi:uncharacterized protein (DUF2345 family)